jgi:hypothetical protein
MSAEDRGDYNCEICHDTSFIELENGKAISCPVCCDFVKDKNRYDRDYEMRED